MSSLVNKSGVRFAPKIKQRRRSVTVTPGASRRTSVTPSIDNEIKKRDEEDQQNSEEESNSENEGSDKETTFPTQSQPNASKIRRRSSAAGPLENKQRRLSTLSNTPRLGFLNRKNSVTSILNDKESSPVVILDSRRGSIKSRKSSETNKAVPINILTPPNTQQLNQTQTQPTELPSEQEKETQVLPSTPTEPLSKSAGKEILSNETEEPKEKDQIETPLFVPEDNEVETASTDLPTSSSESNPQASETITPPSSESLQQPGHEYLTYENGVLKRNRSSDKQDLPTNFLLKEYTELTHISKTLQNEQTDAIRLDESAFKMADLCKPSLPFGRVSTNYQMAKDANSSRRVQRNERRKDRILAKKEKRSLESYEDNQVKEEAKRIVKEEDLLNSENVSTAAQPSVKLVIGQGGQITVDEESRIVDRHANVDTSKLERKEENPFENLVTSGSYGKQRYSDRWDNDERVLLYQGLYQWGTDFGLIAQTFPHRNRRQIKAKFILEEKKNPHLVELALSRKLKMADFDLEKYSEDSNKIFDDLDKFKEKLLGIQKDHEQNLKELSIAKEKAKEEDSERQRRQEEDVRNGWNNKPKTRKERMTELRKHETVLGTLDDIKKKNLEEKIGA